MNNFTPAVMTFILALLLPPQQDQVKIIRLTSVLSFGTSPDGLLLAAQDLTVCPDGSIIVSDKLDYKLKKFDRRGRQIAEMGRRGNREGEFRGPAAIASNDRLVAVADFASNRIQFFRLDLEYERTCWAPGAVLDLQFDPDGGLWVAVLQDHPTFNLVKLSTDGNIERSIQLRNATSDLFENMVTFRVTRDRQIVVAFSFQNRIETWTTDGVFVGDCSVSGFPVRVRKKQISTELFAEGLKVPEDNIFWGITSDPNNNMFVLGGEYSFSPQRDIFEVDRNGGLISLAVAPERCGAIEIGPDGRLYCIENGRTRITVYRMGE